MKKWIFLFVILLVPAVLMAQGADPVVPAWAKIVTMITSAVLAVFGGNKWIAKLKKIINDVVVNNKELIRNAGKNAISPLIGEVMKKMGMA